MQFILILNVGVRNVVIMSTVLRNKEVLNRNDCLFIVFSLSHALCLSLFEGPSRHCDFLYTPQESTIESP